jgi:hypothetical protein
MKLDHFVVGIHVTDRVQKVPEVQRVLTEYGCYIRTRIGLHEAHENFCSPNGLILLDMLFDKEACGELVEKLSALEGIEVKTMHFSHD